VVVVVTVLVVVLAGVDVDVELEVVVVVELDVELEVEPVDVESVLLVVAASTLSGPAKPALAKYPSTASTASAHAAASILTARYLMKRNPLGRGRSPSARFSSDRASNAQVLQKP
jgi:hypothetical protein